MSLGWMTVAGIGMCALLGAFNPDAAGSAETRRANRLAKETSPYLVQHAHNPVDWYPWGPEAFEKARKEDKPIFLSIGYSSCHWCHVMERESFEDESVAQQLNDHFVPIKVDREERPDIDDLYMMAVQLITGRGGWPMSVFLTPAGKPFHGGTYFPRDDFAELLRKVRETWTKPGERRRIDEGAEKLSAAMGAALARVSAPGSITPAVLAPAAEKYVERLDPKNGGFGGAPKFPPPMRLGVLLAQHRRKPDKKLINAVTLTLDRMARGGMYDQVGGGFHRYSVDEKWLVPHFEKMLYDQALIAASYFEAYRETKSEDQRRVGTEVLDFVLRELRDAKGGFWSTLDADSPVEGGEKEEGAFYIWTPQQVLGVLGAADGALFNRIYDITDGGNFEGKSIPNLLEKPLEARAKELKVTPEALRARLQGMRKKLLAARAKRPRPSLDDKVLANWNGLMIRAFALGFDATGDERYRKAAEDAASFVLTTMRGEPVKLREAGASPARRLAHSYRIGRTQPQAFLEDYSFMMGGLLELHRVTNEVRWLEEARNLNTVMEADFWDESAGRFFSTPHHHEALVARATSAEDGATPSGQSMAAWALVYLGRATGDPALRERGARVLNTYAQEMKRYPDAVPNMLLAAFAHFDPTAGAPSQVAADKPVTVTLEAAPKSARPGDELTLSVRLAIRSGWHVGASGADSVTPTTVELAPGPFQLVSRSFPAARALKVAFSPRPQQVFEGQTVIPLKIKALEGADKAREIRVRVRYQACNDRLCDRPVDVTLSAPLTPG
jgi:hypothetical protein